MGALTINRKRSDDYFNSNYKFQSNPNPNPNPNPRLDIHISKKPKISFSASMHPTPDRPNSLKTAASILSQYPATVPKLKREPHAPCRVHKFGFSSVSKPNTGSHPADEMGNALLKQYEKAKNSAISSIKFLRRDKEVIDVDDESEDSSVEVFGIVENRQQGLSVDSRETAEILASYVELDEKAAERNSSDSDLKMAELRSTALELDVFGVPLHKKLLDSAKRRDGTLGNLGFEIKLQEARLAGFQLLRPEKKQEEDVVTEPFVPLTKEEEAEVAHAFSGSNRKRVLVTHENSNIEISGEKLQCLKPGAWLNDEVINVYLELLKEREKREPQKFLKSHFFNTFFYKKLNGRSGYDFKSVKRWTSQRKLGYCLLECDKIFVPIHKEVHWCLAVINKKDEKFQYLDSLRGVDNQVLKVLARYFVDEVKDKTGKNIDVSSWKKERVQDLPDQENGFDCGMFMIKYADFYSRDVGLCFNQEHMPYFRLRTAKEILRLKAE